MDTKENSEPQEIIIDEEIKYLLPALDKETYRLLEENILLNGCRDALVVWDNILVDGYNRYKICTEHDVPFNTVNKEFVSREHVIIWVVSNQISRRNLSPIQLSYFRGRHYRADKQIQGAYQQLSKEEQKCQNDTFAGSTATKLAEQYNVSGSTVIRDSKLSLGIDAIGEVTPEAKQKILSGEVTVNKKNLQKLVKGEDGSINAIATEIAEGTYKKKKPAEPEPARSDPGYSGNPGNPGDPESIPLTTSIDKLTQDFQSNLRKLAGNGDSKKLKSTLRTYIDTLETLYSQI